MAAKKEEFSAAFQTLNNELLVQSFVILIINCLSKNKRKKVLSIVILFHQQAQILTLSCPSPPL